MTSWLRRRERGQMMLVAGLILPMLLGMSAMAIDLGSYAAERRSLQSDADSIALAAGQDLPDAAAVQAAAAEWAANNDVPLSDITVTVSGGNTSPQVRVEIERSHEFSFIRVLGIDARDVGASATAAKYSTGGGTGIVPWAVTQDTVDNAASGELVTIKYDSKINPGQGNFGPVRFDGSGGSDYEDDVMYGSNYTVCSNATPNCTVSACPGSYPSTCSEDSPECDGPECLPKTGNMTGPTADATDHRMTYTSAACDSFDEVFTLVSSWLGDTSANDALASGQRGDGPGGRLFAPAEHHGAGSHPTFTPTHTPTRTNTPLPTATATPVPPTATNTAGPAPTSTATNTPTATATPPSGPGNFYALDPDCNPWAGGGCTSSTAMCSRRVFLIPIIDDFGNGSSDPVEIQGFALVYLEGYDDGQCSGNSCEIKARFVRADVTTNSFIGSYDPDANVHFVRLIE